MNNPSSKRITLLGNICRSLLIVVGILGGKTASPAAKPEALLDLGLDQLVNVQVESASRFKQKLSEAPSAVEVLTAEDIRSFGWRTLADALKSVRGLDVRNDRNYSYLGSRGISRTGDFSSRILLMIDGRRMNEAIYDTAFIAEEFMLDMNLIERIEYIPGAGSSVYGANALLGVINVITKKGKDFDGLRLSGEAGSLNTFRGRATVGKQWKNGADILLNASQYYSHGQDRLYFPEYADTHGGIAQDKDQERTKRLFGKFNYKDITLAAGYVDRYKNIPTAAFGAIFNEDNFSVDRQAYVDLDYNTQLNADLNLEARAFHHWYDYYAIGPYISNKGVRLLNYEAAHSHWEGGQLKLTGTQFTNHKWIAGVEFQYDDRQYLDSYSFDPITLKQGKHYPSNTKGWRLGAYLQDEYHITENLILNAGLRLDQHHMIKTLQLNPRVALIWNITPALTTKLLYSSAFRAPNALEFDTSIPRSPNNREERIKSYEAIAEWYPMTNLKLLGTVFHNDFTRVLTLDNSTYLHLNTGHFKTYGFELEGEKRWDNGRLLKLSWTHNYTRDEVANNGSWATDSPKNMVKLNYAEPFLNDRLRLGFEEIFIDQRRTLGNNIAPGYHLMNINLALAKPWYGFQASLGVYNVLDQRIKMVAGSEHEPLDTLTMDGRTVRFRLEFGF